MEAGTLFEQVVRARRATRQFLSTPLTADQISTVLGDAQFAPSNCNTQPWHVHVVSGATKQRLSAALISDEEQGYRTPDFSFDSFEGVHAERHRAMAKCRNNRQPTSIYSQVNLAGVTGSAFSDGLVLPPVSG